MKAALKLVILFLLLFGTVSPVLAASTAHAVASLRWSNYVFSFTGTGSFSSPALTGSVFAIDQSSQGFIPPCQFICPAFLSAVRSITLPFGSESAQASASNQGTVSAVADVSTNGPPIAAFSFSTEDVTFVLTGTGTGTMSVTAPYTLNGDCTADAFEHSKVLLSTPGGPSDSRERFACSGSASTGNLTLSFPVTATPQGTSIKIHLEASAQAAVPEESTLILTSLGILGLIPIGKMTRLRR